MKARRGSYGRLVAWVEKNYGRINVNDSEIDVKTKFEQALLQARFNKGEKAVTGLKMYVEKGLYKGLIKEQ
ncbi:MAG: hypothetical protein ACFFCZ_03480 [Promethearchaeota archaeon]